MHATSHSECGILLTLHPKPYSCTEHIGGTCSETFEAPCLLGKGLFVSSFAPTVKDSQPPPALPTPRMFRPVCVRARCVCLRARDMCV